MMFEEIGMAVVAIALFIGAMWLGVKFPIVGKLYATTVLLAWGALVILGWGYVVFFVQFASGRAVEGSLSLVLMLVFGVAPWVIFALPGLRETWWKPPKKGVQ